MSCGVVVEGMDRARRATLNFFTETLRVTHPAPANIMDLLMAADGLPTARERCVACSVVSERHDGVYSSHHWQDTFYWILTVSDEAIEAIGWASEGRLRSRTCHAALAGRRQAVSCHK